MEHEDDMTRDRDAAVANHKQLRTTKASIIAMGKFYLSLLEQGVWPSQRAMATELDISFPQVSRMVAAARLPEAVLNIFKNRAVSFRSIDTLQTLTRQLGEAEIVRRARCVTHDCSLEDVFSVLTTGKPVMRRGVRVSIVPGKKYLRLDVPNFERIAPRIVELEQILNALLATANGKHWIGASGNSRTQHEAPKKAPGRS
jgi:hypothetical protein